MPIALPLLLFAQAAPPIVPAPLPIPRAARSTVPAAPGSEPSRFAQCVEAAKEDPLAAVAAAEEWLKVSKGTATIQPNQCLGIAYNLLGRPVEAEVAFSAARDAVPSTDRGYRAQLGLAAAQMMLLQEGEAARAEAAFAAALEDARTTADRRLIGNILIARSHAQVALGQLPQAAASLAEGRTASPDNPEGWLLSATLARRQGQLAEAQKFIEQAAMLAPRDPAVGLEAGVIAVLSGRDEAARRSWQSVMAVAPGSEWAKTAQGYLDQLGPAPAVPAPAEGR